MSYSDDDDAMVDETIEDYNDEAFDEPDEELPPPPASTRIRPPTATRRRETSPIPTLHQQLRSPTTATFGESAEDRPADDEYSDDSVDDVDLNAAPKTIQYVSEEKTEESCSSDEQETGHDTEEAATNTITADRGRESEQQGSKSEPVVAAGSTGGVALPMPLSSAENFNPAVSSNPAKIEHRRFVTWTIDSLRDCIATQDSMQRFLLLLERHAALLDSENPSIGHPKSGFEALLYLFDNLHTNPAHFELAASLLLPYAAAGINGNNLPPLATFLLMSHQNGADDAVDVVEDFLHNFAKQLIAPSFPESVDVELRLHVLQQVVTSTLAWARMMCSASATNRGVEFAISVLKLLLHTVTAEAWHDSGAQVAARAAISCFLQVTSSSSELSQQPDTLARLCSAAVVTAAARILVCDGRLPAAALADWVLRDALPESLRLFGLVDDVTSPSEQLQQCLPGLMEQLQLFSACACHAEESVWGECVAMSLRAIGGLKESLPSSFFLHNGSLRAVQLWIHGAAKFSPDTSQHQRSTLYTLLSVVQPEWAQSVPAETVAVVSKIVQDWLISASSFNGGMGSSLELLQFSTACAEEVVRLLLAVEPPQNSDLFRREWTDCASLVFERVLHPTLLAIARLSLSAPRCWPLCLRSAELASAISTREAADRACSSPSVTTAIQTLLAVLCCFSARKDMETNEGVTNIDFVGAQLTDLCCRCIVHPSTNGRLALEEALQSMIELSQPEGNSSGCALTRSLQLQYDLEANSRSSAAARIGFVSAFIEKFMRIIHERISGAFSNTLNLSPRWREGMFLSAASCFTLLAHNAGRSPLSVCVTLLPMECTLRMLQQTLQGILEDHMSDPSATFSSLAKLLNDSSLFTAITLMKVALAPHQYLGLLQGLIAAMSAVAAVPAGCAYLQRLEMDRLLVTTLRDAAPDLKLLLTGSPATDNAGLLARSVCSILELLVFTESECQALDEEGEERDWEDAAKAQRTFYLLWKRDKFVAALLRAAEAKKLQQLLVSGPALHPDPPLPLSSGLSGGSGATDAYQSPSLLSDASLPGVQAAADSSSKQTPLALSPADGPVAQPAEAPELETRNAEGVDAASASHRLDGVVSMPSTANFMLGMFSSDPLHTKKVEEPRDDAEQSFFCGAPPQGPPGLLVTEASGMFIGSADGAEYSRLHSHKSGSTPTLSPRFLEDSAVNYSASCIHTPRRKSEALQRAAARQSILAEMAGKDGDYPPTVELEYQLRSLVDDLRLKPEEDKSIQSHLNMFRRRSGSLDNVAKWMVQREIKRLQAMKDAVVCVIKAIRARDDVLDQIHTFVAKYERNPEFYAEGTCDGILTELLRRIRECTIGVNESIASWKMTQRLAKASTHGSLVSPRKNNGATTADLLSPTLGVPKSATPSLTPRSTAENGVVFLYNGVDYAAKMQHDLQFLYHSVVQKFVCIDLDYQTFLQQKRRYTGTVISEEEFRTRNFFSRLAAPKGTLPVSREAGSLDPAEVDFKIQELAVDFHKGNNCRFRNAVAGHVNVLRRMSTTNPGSPLPRLNSSFTGRGSISFATNMSVAGSSTCGDDNSNASARRSNYVPVKIDPHGALHQRIRNVHKGSVLVDTETRMVRRNPLDRFAEVDKATRRLTRDMMFRRRANSVVMMKKLQERSMQSQTSKTAQNVAHMLAVRNTSQRWWGVVFMICLVDIFYQRIRENVFQSRAARIIQRWFHIVFQRAKYGRHIQNQIIRLVPSMADFYAVNRPSIISDVTRLFVISTKKAIVIQRFVRNRRSRRQVVSLIRLMCHIIRLQRTFKRNKFRTTLIRHIQLRIAARRIVSAVLMIKRRQRRKRENLERRSAIKIQRWYRICKAKEALGMRKERLYAVCVLQRWSRGTLGRRRAALAAHVRVLDRHLKFLLSRKNALTRALRRVAATRIQCIWRQHFSRAVVARKRVLKQSNLRIYLHVDETTAQRRAIAMIMALYKGGRTRREMSGAIEAAPQPGDPYYTEPEDQQIAKRLGSGTGPALMAGQQRVQRSALFQQRTRHIIQSLIHEFTPVVLVMQKFARMVLGKQQLATLRSDKWCRRKHLLAWMVNARRIKNFRRMSSLKARDQFKLCLQRAIFKRLERERLEREQAEREYRLKECCAARIQALFRGFTTRMDFRESQAQHAMQMKAYHQQNLLEHSAVTIQTRMRLYLVKKRIIERLRSRRERAARRIQSAWRTVLGLREAAEARHQLRVKRTLAALSIQTAWRCYVEYRQEKLLVLEESM
jgi:hypothetical protein